MPGPGFLDLPVRSAKPRRTGITHVLDRGTPLAQVTELLVQNECYVDVWKFGWGIAYLDPQLAAKLDLLARHRVLASPGGTLLEIAWAQGRAPEFLDWAADAGFPCVEVSAGTVPMDDAAKRDLIAAAAERFIVLAEVGSKHAAVRLTPEQWGRAAAGDHQAVYERSGTVRQDVVEALAAAVGPDCVVFEAPREDQQAWFVRRFGPDVNLANVPPDGALGLETFRLSLRADTYGAWTPGPVMSTAPVHGT